MNSYLVAAHLVRKPNHIRASWLAALSLIMFVPCQPADARTGSQRAISLRSQLEAIVKLGPPAALATVRSSGTQQRIAVGVADISTGRKAHTNDVWRIASVTKLVTAAIVLRLAQQRRLKLEDRLSKYLPGTIDLADQISIRQLLNHTSGIPDYLSAPNIPFNVSARRLGANLLRQRTPEKLLRDARRQPRRFKPGAEHEYSNTNYLLLGMVIERVTGKSFQSVVQEQVITTLKLERTGFPDRKGRVPFEHLRGYLPGDSKAGPFKNRRALVDVTAHDYFLGADGGLFSSLDETSRILKHLLHGPLFGPLVRRSMISNLVPDHDGFYRYGLGIMAFELPCGMYVYGHEGRDLGIYTVALFDPAHERTFVLAANMSFGHEWGIQDRIDKLRNGVFCRLEDNCRKRHKH